MLVPVLPAVPDPSAHGSKLSHDALLERLVVFLVSASLAGVVLAVAGFFLAPLAVAMAGLCTWAYHLRVRGSASPAPNESRLLYIGPILLVALCFRLAPFDYVMGGQDQGLYTNIAAHLVQTHGIALADPELHRLAGSAAQANYQRDNYVDPFLPGVYTSDDGKLKLTFQFYHLFPVWLAMFAGLFGASAATYGLTFLSLVSIIFFHRLATQLTGSPRLGALAGLMLALNPLHAFFSRFPVTEVPTLAFSLIGFTLIAVYSGTRPGERRSRWLWLSALAFGCLFLTRISGFLYLPIVLALGTIPLVLDDDRERALGLARWALATSVLYLASVAYGLAWSRPYSISIYHESFSRVGGHHWPTMMVGLFVFAAVVWSSAWLRPGGTVGRMLAWAAMRLSRWMGLALLLALVAGCYRIYVFAFTGTYTGVNPFSLFPGTTAQGWSSVPHSSLVAIALYLCPVLFLAFVWLAQLRWNPPGRFFVFFLLCITAYVAVFNWFMPYQPYYGRYLVSELLPYSLLFVVCALGWTRQPTGRKWLSASLGLAGLYFLVLSAGQVGKHADEFARESIARLADVADDGDVILLDDANSEKFTPREIKTTLVYTFNRHVISINRERWLDVGYLDGLDAVYDDVYLATQSLDVPSGFERVDAMRMHANGFIRYAGPPWRTGRKLDANLVVYRMARPAYGVGSHQVFSPATDVRFFTQQGRRDAGRGVLAEGRAGYLVFGPYIALPPGHFEVRISGRQQASDVGEARLEVASAKGSRILAASSARATSEATSSVMGTLEFEVPDSGVEDLEIRIAVDDGSQLEVSRIELSRVR
ncbi:MAG: hypothetical protein A3E01_10905 [Gammaproteobacteria bacterium RIFCSPHIGHO2_12_FULL_63_22]|nr:MAG: hypothetical protein A3E01_10905 [Gammaproteobacteria bacterium RIFCSPHIGHO2_12_FULL_63_22]